MTFQPITIDFFGNGCKIVNYNNLKSSPVYTIPKDSRCGWLSNKIYSPIKTGEIKTKSNCQYTELYNTREQYINESKKQKAPSYSFGKAGIKEDEFYRKTKRKKRAKSAKNKNFTFKEENFNGDNCANNQNNISNKEEKQYNQYYEIGTKYVNESRKPKAPLYSFAGGPFKENYKTVRKVDNKFYPKNDFYEINKEYINESKKPRIVGYSFGKEKRIDPNIKKKWKYKYNGNIKENNKNNKNIVFEEEKNLNKGDNCPNLIIKDEQIEKEKNKNINKNINNNLTQYSFHDYYNVIKYYINESQKPRVVGYSFGKTSGVKPKIIKGKNGEGNMFYNIREKYINESQKPFAPKYSFGRPKTSIPQEKKKKKKYRLMSKSAIFNNNKSQSKVMESRELKDFINKKNGPGPGSYEISGNIGENALKISLSPFGRIGPKDNRYPGPGHYMPNYKIIKKQYPIYSIGNDERFEYYEDYYYPNNNKMNLSYGSQYYRRNPSWIIAKNCKYELLDRIQRENNRYK